MNDTLYTITLSPDSFANMPSFPSGTPHIYIYIYIYIYENANHSHKHTYNTFTKTINDTLHTITLSPDSVAKIPSFPSGTPHRNGSPKPRFITNSIILLSALVSTLIIKSKHNVYSNN